MGGEAEGQGRGAGSKEGPVCREHLAVAAHQEHVAQGSEKGGSGGGGMVVGRKLLLLRRRRLWRLLEIKGWWSEGREGGECLASGGVKKYPRGVTAWGGGVWSWPCHGH